ncbi:MAG: HAMP domain-containing sensor histidine kinase [Holophagaceae bacterium]
MPWLRNHLRALLALLGAFLLGLGASAWMHRGVPGSLRISVLALTFLILLMAARWLIRWLVVPVRATDRSSDRSPVSLEELPRLWADLERENLSLRELREAEDALRKGILARLQEGVLLFGPDRSLRLYNPAAEALLGRGAALVKGASAESLFREPEARRQLAAAQAGEAVEWTLERGHRILRIRGLPFRSGAAGSLLLTLDDVSRQEALENTRQRFISNLSHELKTPLTSLRIATDNLQAERTQSGVQDADIALLQRAVERMTLLLDDISELSRIESGALRLNPGPVEVGAFAKDLLEEFAPHARQKSLRLHADLAPGTEATVVRVDGLRLHQLLANLVSNGLKFSPPGREVALAFALEGGRQRWEVRDQGPGIALEDQAKVFERFFRSASVRSVPGTGLGLAIVKHLARLMGGEVGFESRPGAGATFWVDLPAGAEGPALPPPSRP